MVKMIIIDVDGVLTDGTIVTGDSNDELKFFNVKDGIGIQLALAAGIKVVLITGRFSNALVRRAKELRVDEVCQNAYNKLSAYENLLKKHSLTDKDVCYIGDDIPDIPVLKRAGISYAVNDAVDEVKSAAEYVTQRNGGKGAVREMIDTLLKSEGLWNKAYQKLLAGS